RAACDHASFETLSAVAEDCGWNCFAGSESNVLERFCSLAKKTGADVILRATADNPFLFYEAAEQSLAEFQTKNCDYFTFTGLPHGSGIEVFSSAAIFKAATANTTAYEREHVGPALYNHPEIFSCVFSSDGILWANQKNCPEYAWRTTVDTAGDYRKAVRIQRYLKSKNLQSPYASKDIIDTLSAPYVIYPILLIPAIATGRGTGHIRRCAEIIRHFSNEKNLTVHFDIFLKETPSVAAQHILDTLPENFLAEKTRILREFPEKNEYACILTDAFNAEQNFLQKISALAPIIAIDEGSRHTKYIDYSLNIIPPAKIQAKSNAFSSNFISFGEKRREPVTKAKKILISIGGEDPAHFASKIFDVTKQVFADNSCVVDCPKGGEIPNLKDIIHTYDIVITHYGFTAFEAATAGCAVITVATSPVHKKLSKLYGCVCLTSSQCTAQHLKKLCENPQKLIPHRLIDALQKKEHSDFPLSLNDFTKNLQYGKKYACPVCGKTKYIDKIIARDSIKTIRKCTQCSVLYTAFCLKTKDYKTAYFFEEYKTQYGKTYLEDFESIKLQGVRRLQYIEACLSISVRTKKTILDIGCAYGPFLAAATQRDFIPYGTDISEEAVVYAREKLHAFTATAAFPDFDAKKAFANDCPQDANFDVITMWYVIEHFSDVHAVLQAVSKFLKIGGVFAFSTPNASGISCRKNPAEFFKNSPYDHFTLWQPKHTKKILAKYGFAVKKIVSPTMHKDRFPSFLRIFPEKILSLINRLFCLGDTFEVYCIKKREVQ
ncbi:MAG: methyltransferase domain-containing protein, partial [Spirochaetales bacterium]